VELVTIALFISLVIWFAEKRNSPLRDQPCAKCGKTIHWMGANGPGTGFVHKNTGRAWEPYTVAEWDDLWQNKGCRISELEFPHPAQRPWNHYEVP
jgi:hypothetical protein